MPNHVDSGGELQDGTVGYTEQDRANIAAASAKARITRERNAYKATKKANPSGVVIPMKGLRAK